MSKSKASKAKTPPPLRQRPFAQVPRQILTIAVIVGGLIGIFFATRFNWNGVQSFAFTLVAAILCVLLAVWLYSAFSRKR